MNKEVNDSEDKSAEDEKTFDTSKLTAWMLVLLAAVVAIFLYFRKWFFKGYNPDKEKTKARLAKAYGISTLTLMAWIKKFCPVEIRKKYVGQRINNVRIGDIYPHLGIPIPDVTTSKESLAEHCFMSRNTLRRRIKESIDFEQVVKLSLAEYNQMKIVPPLFFERIIAAYRLNSDEN